MSLFARSAPPVEGWTAVLVGKSRLDVARVRQRTDALPAVTLCESYPLAGGLAATLQRLRQADKLGGRLTTLLAPGSYQLLPVEAPAVPEDAPASELKEAVRWKIKDLVDFPVTAAGIDVLPIPVSSGRPAQLLAAVASHAVLTPLIRDFQAAKLDLAAIDLPELAQRNIARYFETPQRALALLVFNEHGGLLTFTAKGELYASRRIDVSAAELAGGAESGVFDRVVLDVQRSLDNFDRHFSRLTLGRLLVLPVAGAEAFVQHLKDNLYQPVETMRISDGLDVSALPLLANPAILADALPAIGAALRDEETA